MNGFTITRTANGKWKVTYHLSTVWITDEEAAAAATDPKAAAALLRRLR